jgi:integrase
LGDSVKRTRDEIGQVLRHAIGTKRFPNLTDITKAITVRKVKHGKLAAFTDPRKVGQLLADIHEGGPRTRIETQTLLKLLAYVFTRPSELRLGKWEEVDLNNAEWVIPKERMKAANLEHDHAIPLPRQAVTLLKELHRYTGHQSYVFPGISGDKPLSDATARIALQNLGYDTSTEHCPHGFRTTASTLIATLKPDWISAKEAQLAHSRGTVRQAYERVPRPEWNVRVKMLQWYANYLDSLCAEVENKKLATA